MRKFLGGFGFTSKDSTNDGAGNSSSKDSDGASSKKSQSKKRDSSPDSDDSDDMERRKLHYMMKKGMRFDPNDMGADPFFMDPYMARSYMRHRKDPPSNDPFSWARSKRGISDKEQAILDWKEPQMVEPSMEEEPSSNRVHHGFVSTDAKLFMLNERKQDGTYIQHSVLKMPSTLPSNQSQSLNTFNILIADVSGSMSSYWSKIMAYWNEFVAPKLTGKTRIYTFGSIVSFRRDSASLVDDDFSGGLTELTGALQMVVTDVYQCTQKHVNVFIITDGDHTGCSRTPENVIECMRRPKGKVCNVYLLGVGNNFPVQYSMDIRSRLHSGSTNFPALFWAKEQEAIVGEMENIGRMLSGGSSHSIQLSVPATPLPGLPLKKDFYLEELVYLPQEATNFKEFEIASGSNIYQLKLENQDVSTDTLFDIFRQWNTIIIQRRYRKEDVPSDIIPLMERLFDTHRNKPLSGGAPSLAERLQMKDTKREEMEFRQLINAIKSIMTQQKYENEIELAENILATSVKRSKKIEEKALQLKGHTDAEYEEDLAEFTRVLEENREGIRSLRVEPEYCCSATKQSTIADLQDVEGFKLLKDKNKFEFLKAFTITGIPVFAPTKNSVTLNPWSYSVQRLLEPPYGTMSQVAMEDLPHTSDDNNQERQAAAEPTTSFNAIIPVFSPESASVLQPLVRTKLYAMCVTFATMKNPHIVDFNIHMAALGVTWIRCLYEHPTTPRSEFVRNRMLSIEATAACYMDRPGYAKYTRILIENTPQALMTESTEVFDGQAIRCETIVKPMFILYMTERCGNTVDASTKYNIMKLILLEYIGRCISHYKPGGKFETSEDDEDNTRAPYSDFFVSSFADQHSKVKWLQKYLEDAKTEMRGSGSGLLESYYTLEKVRKMAETVAKTKVDLMKNDMAADFTIKVNMERAIQLRDVTLAGDLSWETLKTFAREVGLADNAINELFSEESMFLYVAHALSYKSSRDRLSADHLSSDVLDFNRLKTQIMGEVQKENLSKLTKDLYSSLISMLEEAWLREYLDVHTEVVEPMSIQQIVYIAKELGIDVTEETFSTVYKRYRPKVGLLGNACQTKACPYYLIPDKTYNQHASVERLKAGQPFMHSLHQTTSKNCEKDMSITIQELTSGISTKDKNPIPSEVISKWTGDIKKLINIYHEQLKASSSGSGTH